MSAGIDHTSDRKTRARRIVKLLKKLYPDAATALTAHKPLQLLVATILAAQCTDARVNIITADLFKKYRSARDYANADPTEFENQIKTAGFYRQKTKSIIKTCQIINKRFAGKVPDTMEGLLELPGVARKTANCVLGGAFGKNEGIAVDTHVGRISVRLGLTVSTDDPKNAVKIERDLMEIVPRNDWCFFNHAMILHGRRICQARKPKHDQCHFLPLCPTGQAETRQ